MPMPILAMRALSALLYRIERSRYPAFMLRNSWGHMEQAHVVYDGFWFCVEIVKAVAWPLTIVFVVWEIKSNLVYGEF